MARCSIAGKPKPERYTPLSRSFFTVREQNVGKSREVKDFVEFYMKEALK